MLKKDLDSLLKQHQKQALAIAIKMIGNLADAEDITQASLFRVYKNLDSFEQRSQFSTWSHRITINLCLSFLARRKDNIPIGYEDFIEKNNSNPELELECKQLINSKLEPISKLSKNHYDVIVMKDFKGLSCKQIAKELDVKIGTVLSRLHYARKELQKLL